MKFFSFPYINLERNIVHPNKTKTVQSLIAFAKGRKLESYQREISLPLIADTHEPRSTEYD